MKILETTVDYSLKDDFYGDVTITFGKNDDDKKDDDDDDKKDSGFDDVQNIREYIMSSVNDYSR